MTRPRSDVPATASCVGRSRSTWRSRRPGRRCSRPTGRRWWRSSTAAAAPAAALFPPQNRDWALPSEANVSPKAAERVCRESAQKAFDEAAKSLNMDWNTTLDGKQLQRWSEALGRGLVAERDHQSQAYREGRYPPGPANAPQLLVIGMDGGRWQG